MKKIIPFLVALGVAGVFFLRSAADKILFSVDGVKFNSAASLESGYSSLVFDVFLRLKNNSSVTIPVNSFEINMFYQGQKIAIAKNDVSFNLPGNNFITESFPVSVNVNSSLVAVRNLFSDLKVGRPISTNYSGFVNIPVVGKIYFSGNKIIA